MGSRRIGRRVGVVFAGLLLVGGRVGHTQPPKMPSLIPPPHGYGLPVPPPPTVAPPSPSLDELMTKLELLRADKSDLEKREKAVVEEIRMRLKTQGQRLEKLGVTLPVPTPVKPAAGAVLPHIMPEDVPQVPPPHVASPAPVKPEPELPPLP